MWGLTLDTILANPWGVGFGNWAVATRWPYNPYPHNIFLEVFAECGVIIGFLLVATCLLIIVRLALVSKTDPTAGLALAILIAETVAVSLSGDINARTFFAMLTMGFVILVWSAKSGGTDIRTLRMPPSSGHEKANSRSSNVLPKAGVHS